MISFTRESGLKWQRSHVKTFQRFHLYNSLIINRIKSSEHFEFSFLYIISTTTNVSSTENSLDPIGEDDEAYEDTYCPIQIPHLGLMLKHFSTDEDGEPHDSPHQWVKSWNKKIHKHTWCKNTLYRCSLADMWCWLLWYRAAYKVSSGVIDSWHASVCLLKGHLVWMSERAESYRHVSGFVL